MKKALAKVAERLNRRHRIRRGSDLPPLLMMTDERRLADPLAALRTLPPGNAVILRHYGLSATERRSLAEALRTETRARRHLLLIARDISLARHVKADGVHFPEIDLARLPCRAALPAHWLVTAAAHTPLALRRAAGAAADAAVLSPVFATGSHPGARRLGVVRAASWAMQAPLPVYALGGISHETAPRLMPFAFAGLAAVSAFQT